jgi:L-galactonate dehydratase
MADITITGWTTRDVRFPTSLDKTGSDAMNAAGDYSAAYCILETTSSYTGHGMVCDLPPARTNYFANRPRLSRSVEETTLSAKPLTTSPTESRARLSPL